MKVRQRGELNLFRVTFPKILSFAASSSVSLKSIKFAIVFLELCEGRILSFSSLKAESKQIKLQVVTCTKLIAY